MKWFFNTTTHQLQHRCTCTKSQKGNFLEEYIPLATKHQVHSDAKSKRTVHLCVMYTVNICCRSVLKFEQDDANQNLQTAYSWK